MFVANTLARTDSSVGEGPVLMEPESVALSEVGVSLVPSGLHVSRMLARVLISAKIAVSAHPESYLALPVLQLPVVNQACLAWLQQQMHMVSQVFQCEALMVHAAFPGLN